MTLQHTPLYDRHVALGAKLADFGGWDMPIEYTGTVGEHTAVRDSVGIFDVSHMGTTTVTGPGAAAWLNSILANDLERIPAGKAQYSLLCDTNGGVIDDLIVYRFADDDLLIVPNASNSDAVVAVLKANAPAGLSVTDERAHMGILAIQGPRSTDILTTLGLPTDHDYMSVVRTTWKDVPLTVCRSGYTGEHGYEIIAPSDVLGDLWDACVNAGATPAGLGARDTLRTEMGYPLHGHELSEDITPVQARIGWAIGWDKPNFHGKDALAAEKAAGPEHVLRGLLASERAIPRAGMAVLSPDGNVVGALTSGTFSPTLKQGIGLALLDPSIAEGDEVLVDIRGRHARFVVTRPPFVESHVR